MNQEITTNPNGQTDRLISQRQFCKKYGTTPALMNDFENMGVILPCEARSQVEQYVTLKMRRGIALHHSYANQAVHKKVHNH